VSLTLDTFRKFKSILERMPSRDREVLTRVIDTALFHPGAATHVLADQSQNLAELLISRNYSGLVPECTTCGNNGHSSCPECGTNSEEISLDFEPSVPLVEVWVFKESGKYYTHGVKRLSPEHLTPKGELAMPGFELMDLFKTNHPSVWGYSPVTNHFKSDEFSYFIHVHLPAGVPGFCLFLMTPENRKSYLQKNPELVLHSNPKPREDDSGL
jgi:hypothetical protein